MENYEINKDTLALISLKNKTEVFEENDHFFVDKVANEIMEASCAYFGSSLSGRQKGTENLIGSTYKAPVIVEEKLSFFQQNLQEMMNVLGFLYKKLINIFEWVIK